MTHPESNQSSPWSTRRYRGALVAIVLLACAPRFEQIDRVGIRFDDESAYVFDAGLWHRCARLALDPRAIEAAIRLDKAALRQRMDTIGVDFGDRYIKPSQGYTFLGALMMFGTGEGPVALLTLNALCGTLSVLVLAALGTTLFHRGAGLFAALMLAVSPYHLLYCRSVFPYATAGLFVLIGVWRWARWRQSSGTSNRAAAVAGLSLGYATLCHYSAGYVLMLCLVFEVMRRDPGDVAGGIQTGTWRLRTRRCALLALTGLLPFVAVEAVFQAVLLGGRIADCYLPLTSLAEAAWRWVWMIRAGTIQISGVGLINWGVGVAYVAHFLHWHTWLLSILVLVGLVVSWRTRGPGRLPAVLVVVTLGLLSLQRFTIPRAAAVAVPFACLCAAVAACVGIAVVARKSKPWGHGVGLSLAAAIIVVGVANGARLKGGRSDLQRACAFVNDEGGAVAVPLDSGRRHKYAHYLDPRATRLVRGKFHRMGSPDEVLVTLRREGVRWFIADPQHWHLRDPEIHPEEDVFRWWRSFYERLEDEAVLAAVFPHLENHRWEFLAEGPGLRYLPEMIAQREGSLRVYDLTADRDASGAATPHMSTAKHAARVSVD